MSSILPLIAGTWFIISTNFPMWLKGDKTHPTFNYTLMEKKGRPCLGDEVRYLHNGKTKSILGFDFQDADNPMAFTWKGKGILFFVKSHWEIKLLDSQQQWAVIWFSKTMFTPEGVDIISRDSILGESALMHIKSRMMEDSVLKKHVGSLKEL